MYTGLLRSQPPTVLGGTIIIEQTEVKRHVIYETGWLMVMQYYNIVFTGSER